MCDGSSENGSSHLRCLEMILLMLASFLVLFSCGRQDGGRFWYRVNALHTDGSSWLIVSNIMLPGFLVFHFYETDPIKKSPGVRAKA